MVDGESRTHYFWLPNCGDIPHICNIHDTNNSAMQHMNSAHHEQNREREKNPTTELNIFPLEIFFDGK